MSPFIVTVILLCCSNVFMTFAWYGHLANMQHRTWVYAAPVSWGIALFEYLLQVPANRIGYQVMNVGQLKILQEVITLTVFVPFSLFLYEREAVAGLSVGRLVSACRLLGRVEPRSSIFFWLLSLMNGMAATRRMVSEKDTRKEKG